MASRATRQPRGRAVGEEQAQLEQGGQRQGAPGEPVDQDERRGRDGKENREVPALLGPVVRGTQRQMGEQRHQHRRGHGCGEDGHPDTAGESRSGGPSRAIVDPAHARLTSPSPGQARVNS